MLEQPTARRIVASFCALLLLAGACARDASESLSPGALASIQSTATSAVLVGAGDIAACTSDGDEATAVLLDGIAGTVFTTGDNVYPDGTDAEFSDCYHPSWGRHKDRTRPTPGDHDYHTRNGTGYYKYFGANAGDPKKGYYSYDLGSWHIVVLNSMLPLHRGSTQERWLRSDLSKNARLCTIAYWHHPRFSSGKHGSYTFVQPAWDALYEAGAEIVLAGNDHSYERFAPQTPSGAADAATGIRQFVVGTGGRSLYAFQTPIANSEVQYNSSYGLLKLTLEDGGYTWEFVPTSGTFTDSGSGVCH